jgi:hypothetical protein
MSLFHAAGKACGYFVKEWLLWLVQVTVVNLLIGIGEGVGWLPCEPSPPYVLDRCIDGRFAAGLLVVVSSFFLGSLVLSLIACCLKTPNKAKVD